eukprot:Sdes_comp24138_c0_seq1m22173
MKYKYFCVVPGFQTLEIKQTHTTLWELQTELVVGGGRGFEPATIVVFSQNDSAESLLSSENSHVRSLVSLGIFPNMNPQEIGYLTPFSNSICYHIDRNGNGNDISQDLSVIALHIRIQQSIYPLPLMLASEKFDLLFSNFRQQFLAEYEAHLLKNSEKNSPPS